MGPSHCRSFRRLTNEFSRPWTPTRMAYELKFAEPRPYADPDAATRGDRALGTYFGQADTLRVHRKRTLILPEPSGWLGSDGHNRGTTVVMRILLMSCVDRI